MIVIPAIDIVNGNVVRLVQGKFGTEKSYSKSPVDVAMNWKEKGASLIHVVDLDGASRGKPVNLSIVKEIVGTTGIDIELGGGLRTEADIENAIEVGLRYVVVGTSAVSDESFLKTIVKRFPDKIIGAIDVKDGRVAIKGWKEVSDENVLDYAKRLETTGVKRMIYTDISKDGMLKGPNIEALESILGKTSLEVVASGGITTIEDIMRLKSLEEDGITGAIVGKALYEGKIDLAEAISVS